VARLGRWAVKEGKEFVEFSYSPTEKNVIALEFMRSIGEQYRNPTNGSWLFPAERLASVEYNPDERAPGEGVVAKTEDSDGRASRRALAFDGADRSECLQKIGENLCDIDQLADAIEQYRIRTQPFHAAADVTPGSKMETALADIWRKVLGKPQIGMDDNFFEVGGTSLRAVQVIALIKKELGKSLSIVSLFECPTVRLLAAKLSATSGEVPSGTTTTAAAQRGQQRRYNTMKQKAS
jgi:acyl carrier protein